ncbi:S8 family serine peptidase [Jeotgalibacillus sp. R-1-5s-1]|uniref:S8 family serine peptidase n=1 Tax=Jeotgalibacillus sp. R-1-5s-1 TaxID=2555897 RepID=UPI00106B0F46|nr:S8 family serine peptidase [Jeotgalibacillus sp. R-1-5s-1]TFD97069.1 hypothetical protein E2491_10280 [Jeotgalibacillus sp. R-1-5s-1]
MRGRLTGISASLALAIALMIPHSVQGVGNSLSKDYLILLTSGTDSELVSSFGGVIYETFDSFDLVSASLDTSAYEALRLHPNVLKIEADAEVELEAQQEDYGAGLIGAKRYWDSNLTGKGIKIGIIDSGIDTKHFDLKVTGGASFVDYTTSYHDDNGHGTHVAGIVAALNNSVGYRGIAPNAELYALKVFDADGGGNISGLVHAIQWAIDHELDIINMSLGAQADSTALRLAIEQASKEGLLLVSAAGNDGTGSGNTVDYPAAYPQTIAVGAVDQQLRLAPFSSTGAAVDLTAPGVLVSSTYFQNQYAKMSGTSMATPYVSAMAALLMEAKPQATATEIRDLLQKNAKDLGASGRDPLFGQGLVQSFAFANAQINEVKSIETFTSYKGIAGTSQQLKVTAVYQDGTKKDVSKEAVWTSNNSNIVSVEANTLKYLKAGKTTVTATFSGISKTSTVTVTESNPIITITAPKELTGQKGQRMKIKIQAIRKNGTTITLTPDNSLWTTSNPAIFTTDRKGEITLKNRGTATLTIQKNGVKSTVVVKVR